MWVSEVRCAFPVQGKGQPLPLSYMSRSVEMNSAFNKVKRQMKYPNRPTWLEIDLSAIRNNVQQLRRIVDKRCEIMSVVKANAYGHGAVQIAKTVLQAGAKRLAVAALCEAMELRESGIRAPILVLGYTPPWQAQDALDANVTLTVYDLECVTALNAAAARTSRPAAVHVKVNTGMNRLGVSPGKTAAFLAELQTYSHIYVEGLFTHFATADETDKDFAHAQFHTFSRLLSTLRAADLCPAVTHAANSAATLTMPHTHLDMVRPGIATYGLHPDVVKTRLPAGFAPALSWKATVVQIRDLQPGDAVSYGREFIAERPMRIAVIPVGYADGFPRAPYHWGSVLIAGQPAPILGRVCMDQTIVDVTSIETPSGRVQQGAEVVLIGQQCDAELSAETVGQRLGTINYDVVSGILARVPRIYTGLP